MKKSLIFTLLIFTLVTASAAETVCSLDISLLNQDPYPAVPGDYVKLVFQISGIDSTNCNDITLKLSPTYPITFNPGETGIRTFKKIDYIKDFKSTLQIPYEVRIDPGALDGANPIEITVQSKGNAPLIKKFDVEIEDVQSDFEAYVKNYDYSNNEVTIEILNIGSSDIEALTVEIPKQDNIQVKGSNRIVVGDLDSNEYTTADFEATIEDGDFNVILFYSDQINTRRDITKTITFDSSYFKDRKADQKSKSAGTYFLYIVVLVIVIYIIYRHFKKKKKKRN